MSNIRCEMIRDLLPLYADNVISDVTRGEINKHLQVCSECRRIYEMQMKDLRLPLLKEDIKKEEDGIRTIQHKLRKEKRNIVLIMTALFTAIILTFYFLGVRGFAASSDDIQYDFIIVESDTGATLTINFRDVNNKSIAFTAETDAENGLYKLILREAPLFKDGRDHFGYAITMDNKQIEDPSADSTIQLIFKDKTETLSWKEIYNDPDSVHYFP